MRFNKIEVIRWSGLMKIYIIILMAILCYILERIKDRNIIKNKINEIGGNIDSIKKGEHFIKEIKEIENKSGIKKLRWNFRRIYKIEYSLDSKKKIIYLIKTRGIKFGLKRMYDKEWIEKPLEE